MTTRYVQKGDSLTVSVAAAGSAITNGDLVKVGVLIGVATNNIPLGGKGTVSLEGVYKVPKAAEAITQGAILNWDDSAEKFTVAAVDETGEDILTCAVAWEGAADTDAEIEARLLPGRGVLAT